MQLNKIYRYYGIPTAQVYAHMKEKFTEAFTGFEGVSFETVEATEETADDGTVTTTPEQYIIYLDNDKSTWLKLYVNTSGYPTMAVYFKNGTSVAFNNAISGTLANPYRQFNIVRTVYGVAFSGIGATTNATEILEDRHITSFFVVGNPNLFVYTKSTSSTGGTANDYIFSSLHEMPEIHNNYSTLNGSTVSRTKLFNFSSLVYPIDCEHLYRIVFTDGNVGRIKINDRYFIMGTRYALEYIP